MRIVKDTNTFRFHDSVEQAIGHLDEATSQISYLSFLEINKSTKDKLGMAIDILKDVLDADIFKPEKD